MIIPNERGTFVCPNCKREFKPKLVRKTDKLIQDEFPNATAEEREQLISGICSNKCWDEFVGFGEEKIIEVD